MIMSISLYGDVLHVEMDNDLIFSSDDSYTGGINITWMGDEYNKSKDGFNELYISSLSDIFGYIPYVDFDGKKLNASFSLQEIIITPSDIYSEEPNYNDMPYVGMLATHFSLYSLSNNEFEQYRITLGTIGENSYAEEIQKGIHALIGNDEPKGWHNQLGPLFIFSFGYLRGFRNYENEYSNGTTFEWFNSYFIDVGNVYIGTGGGTVIRYGKNVPRNFDVQSALFNSSPSKTLNMSCRSKELGWSVEIGTAINSIGYFYIYEESKKKGYDFNMPPIAIISKIGFSLYLEDISMSLDILPTVTKSDTSQSSSWGRLSISWHY